MAEPERQSGEGESWHLDRRIPIALIIALMAQAGAGIWYAGRMDAAIQQHESRLMRLEAQRVADDRDTATLKESLANTLAEVRNDIRWIREVLVPSRAPAGPR